MLCSLISELCVNCCSYEPGPAFEEVKEEAMLDISPTDSTEFWLIQWPKDQIDVLDFHGKELSLKLHSDGNLGNLENSSGKSYEIASFAAQKPDATVFLPSGSETKAGMVKYQLILLIA
ncbi:Mediator-associated protein 2 [Zea mays]|uniref:Mediator-associated protein 2 n=1 Tax=Zea mays TaxID=4577 RepID=A0A1D6MQ01_MAIZE|nr:Mediator-associated protein 2 [Zea mays]